MTVYLVGAGPGDPGLLTVRGAEVLAGADVVVHDRLTHSALRARIPAGCVCIDADQYAGGRRSQDVISALLVEHGRAGRCVVRLEGGDPFLLGRGGEEAAALSAAGVDFEVVPGVTGALAAPAYAGVPVTQRGVSTHVTIVTGHEDPAQGRTDVDWDALARVGGTLVILMGAARAPEIARRLTAAGMSVDTPVAAIRFGTRPEQQTYRATLEALARADESPIRAPSAIVVGAVAALDLAWFTRRPLFGRRVAVTRAAEQASALTVRLEQLGADVLELPTILIEPLPIPRPELASVDWLVFTSVNGVEGFWARGLRAHGLDARALAHTAIVAIGARTADALARVGLVADLVPEGAVGESLVDAFPAPGTRRSVLVARAEVARDVVPAGLAAKGYDVTVLPVYRTVPAPVEPALVARVLDGDTDAVTFTSSSTVDRFCGAVQAYLASGEGPETVDAAAAIRRIPAITIGPVTSATARARGLTVVAQADPHTIEGLVQAVRDVLGAGPVDGAVRDALGAASGDAADLPRSGRPARQAAGHE